MLRRRSAWGAAFLMCAPTLLRGQTPVQFPSAVDVVRLDVVVLDQHGRAVPGLTVDDFEVVEDGRREVITTFEPIVVTPPATEATERRLIGPATPSLAHDPQHGRCFLVFFDDAHVSPSAAEFARRGIARFAEELRPGDWLTVVAPQDVWWTARTAEERALLPKVIARLTGHAVRDPLRTGLTDWQAMRVVEFGDLTALRRGGLAPGQPDPAEGNQARGPRKATGAQPQLAKSADEPADLSVASEEQIILEAEEVYRTARRRLERALVSLEQAIDALSTSPGRKLLLLVSEGFILAPDMPAYRRVMALARTANVAVSFLDPRGLASGYTAEGGAPAYFGSNRARELAGSEDVAEATGGETLAGNDLAADLGRLGSQMDAYYMIGYSPAKTGPGEHKLRVGVRRPGVVAKYRTRYFVLDRGVENTGPSDGRAGALAPLRSVSDVGGLGVLAGAFQFDVADTARGTVNVTGAVEVSGVEDTTLRLALSLRPLDGPQRPPEQITARVGHAPVVLSRDWQLAPGDWQARFVVRDERTGQIGSATHTFEVRRPAGLRLSTPILTDAVEGEGAAARPRLRLSRALRSGATLYCRYEVYGAARKANDAPGVIARYSILRDGAVVRENESRIEPSATGRLARLLGLRLADLPAGLYLLKLDVTDTATGARAESVEPFSILAR